MAKHVYSVAMTCGGCSGAVTRILTKQLKDGETFEVALEDKIVTVTSNRSADEIKDIIAKCGKATEHKETI